jgi:hypothetical protein
VAGTSKLFRRVATNIAGAARDQNVAHLLARMKKVWFRCLEYKENYVDDRHVAQK